MDEQSEIPETDQGSGGFEPRTFTGPLNVGERHNMIERSDERSNGSDGPLGSSDSRGLSAPTRRRVIQAGVAGGLVAWVAPAVQTLSAPAAMASVQPGCVVAGTVTWNGGSFANATPGAIGNYPWTAGTFGSTTMTIDLVGTATSRSHVQTGAGLTGVHNNFDTFGGTTSQFELDKNGAASGESLILRITFNRSIKNLSLTILDVDAAATYIDRVIVAAFLDGAAVNGTYTPVLPTQMTPSTASTNVATATYTGVSTVAPGSTQGNLTVSIPGPLDRIDIDYRNVLASTAGRQAIGISNMSWTC